jgi:protein gp37
LTPEIKSASVGGESGDDARICDYDWVLDIREQCMRAGAGFSYHQTGAKLMKNGRLYHIPKDKQEDQAHRAGIDISFEKGEE